MDNSILKQASGFLHEQKNNKRWHKVLICLAVLVAVGTIAVLMMPGQAQNHTKKVLECPLEVHEHTQECYSAEALALVNAGELTYEELTDADLVCGKADFVVHTHNDDCYENGELVCTLPEIKEHVHTEECYAIERRLICGLEETGDTADGQTPEDGNPDAADPEATETGTTESGTTDPEATDPGDGTEPENQETDGQVPVSGGDQGEDIPQQSVPMAAEPDEITQPHVHTDECYEEVKVLVCGQWELHTHNEYCYDGEGNLICGLLEVLEHVHGEECFKTVELSEEEVAMLNLQNKTEETASGEDSETETDGTEPAEDATDETEESGEPVSGNDAEDGEPVSGGDEGSLTQTFTDGKVVITATYGPEANLPEDAVLYAYEVAPGTDRYEQRRQEALDVLDGSAGEGSEATEEGTEAGESTEEVPAETEPVKEDAYQFVVYNIGFYVGGPQGTEVEPESPVNITIQFLDANGMVVNEGVTVLHFAEDKEGKPTAVEVLDGTAETEENAVNFDVNGFSDFVVAAGAKDLLQQTLPGNGGMAACLYTMAGIGIALTAGLQYKKKLRGRRSKTSQN